MAFRFRLLFADRLVANRLSVCAVAFDAFANIGGGCNTDANCNRDCRIIDFDEEPNSESSLILAKGLFFMWSDIFKATSFSVEMSKR